MTTYITTPRGNKMELNGNVLSGDTFEVRDYIKKYCGGKWDKDNKVWIVDVNLVNKLLNTAGAILRRAN